MRLLNKSKQEESFSELFERHKPPAPAVKKARPVAPSSVRDYNDKTAKSHTHSAPQETRFRSGIQKSIRLRLRKGKIRYEDTLDLHGFKRAEALILMANFLQAAHADGKRCVRIIFGSGRRSPTGAVLKPAVQSYLCDCEYINGYAPTTLRDGGDGAAYVLLKSPR